MPHDAGPKAHGHTNQRKVSQILAELARDFPGERISLGDLLQVLGDRAFGVLMLILSLPNAVGLGTIPGFSTVVGVPQIVIAIQMVMGMSRPWFPQWALRRSLAIGDFRLMAERAGPYLEKGERVLKPRLPALVSPVAERILGAVCLGLAIIVSLPIPFGNQPPAVAIALMSLGIVERDGLFVIIGLVASAIAVAIASTVVAAIGMSALYAFRFLFG